MADLHVDFLGKRLAGPVVAASGTFGFGPEYADIEDLRLLGGIVGVAFSYLLSFILNNVSSMMMSGDGMSSGLLDAFGSLGASGGQISIIPLWLVLAALAFSTLVGLVSGVVPANRAVKISALEAIRRE